MFLSRVACDVSPRRFPEARERFVEAEVKDAILFLDRWTRDMLVSIRCQSIDDNDAPRMCEVKISRDT